MKLSLENIRKEMAVGKRITDMPLKVTAYVRVSTEHEEQKNSLENQENYFMNKIQSNPNWSYVPVYKDEAKSGTSIDRRTDFLRMIEDGKRGKFDLILTKEVSRFARDTLDSIKYTRELLKYDVGVFFEDMSLNTMEPDSEFRLTIMASVAQEESRKLSDRVKFGWQRGTEKGVRRGATPPIGYDFNNDNNGYSINEREACIVRYVFNTYAEGIVGVRTIAESLAGQGYYNKSGKPYNPSTIKRMIANPVYLGNIVNGKSKKQSYREKKISVKPKEEWVLHYDPERVPPLIDKAIWDKANTILNNRGKVMKQVDCKATNKLGGGKYAYSNRIVCNEHGLHYNHAISHWQVDGITKRAEYWRCTLYKKYGHKQCDSPLLYTRDLNNIMRDIFKNITPILNANNDTLSQLIKTVLVGGDKENELQSIQSKLNILQRKKEKVIAGWVDDVISQEDCKITVKKIDEEISKLSVKYQDITHINSSIELAEKSNAAIAQSIENCSLDSEEAIEEIVRCFVKKIIVKKTEGNKYALEIWLYNNNEPLDVQLAPKERIVPCTIQKSKVLIYKSEYTVKPSKIEVSWDRHLEIQTYTMV